jgi:hypothetical protein
MVFTSARGVEISIMKHSDFKIGENFWTCTGEWRCTDVGTRTILAIKLEHPEDPSWYNGPTYAVCEIPFDEDHHPVCYRTKEEHDADFPDSPAPIATSGEHLIVRHTVEIPASVHEKIRRARQQFK